MARYHAKKGVIYLSTSGSGTATTTVSLSAWTLNKATDKVDVTCFGDVNKVYVQGLPDISGTLAGFFDDTSDVLFDCAESTDGVKAYLYPSSDAPTIYHYGTAWLDASLDCTASGAVSISGNFVAAGAWGRKP